MSSVKIEGNASGTGIFTIASPNSNTNRTLTLPDATGTVQVSGNAISGTTGSFSGDLSFNSGYGSTAVAYGCRAWVNFNGTGTVAIRASGNVSSITDNGVGDYTVNFTTAMPDANFSMTAQAWQNAVSDSNAPFTAYRNTTNPLTTSSARFRCTAAGGPSEAPANTDCEGVYVAIFR